jgi:hypothetical protein
VNDIYSDCSNVANYTSHGYKQAAKPIFFNEGVYENEGASKQCLDTQMYVPILGGAVGSVFGNNPIWLFGSGRQSALSSQGSMNQGNFGAFFSSIPWYNQPFGPDRGLWKSFGLELCRVRPDKRWKVYRGVPAGEDYRYDRYDEDFVLDGYR